MLGQQAQAGGVFAVDHGEVNIVFLFQPAQVPVQTVQPALGHHIAHSQEVKQHTVSPFFKQKRFPLLYAILGKTKREKLQKKTKILAGRRVENPAPGNFPRAGRTMGCRNYLAYSTILTSRSRWTLICPGYSSSFSIRWAISRASKVISSSLTTSGLTMMRTSRPA